MTLPSAHEDDVAPDSLIIDITPSTKLPDLTAVTAVAIDVQKLVHGRMSEVRWTGAMSNQTTTTLKVTHPFQPGDLKPPGIYTAKVAMTVPGGTVRTLPTKFEVKGKFDT